MRLGFRPEGELGIPQRWAFKEPRRLDRTNTYVIVDGSLALWNHLRLRDALRASTRLRDRYGAVKKSIGATAASIEEYGEGKNAVIQQILESAGLADELRPRKAMNGSVDPSDEVSGTGTPSWGQER